MNNKQITDLLPNGNDWDKFMSSPSILDDKDGGIAYQAGFKDCLIEIKKRMRKSNTINRHL